MSSGEPATVPQLIADGFRRYGDRVALADDGTTFAGLEDRVARMRGRLNELGVKPGDRVVIAVSTSVQARVLELAVLSGGSVRVAVSTRVHPEELASLAADCASALVVCDDAVVHEVRGAVASIAVVAISQLAGGEPRDDGDGLDAVPSDIAMLIYTSGSTGAAKGATVTQHAWIRQTARSLGQLPPIDEHDLVLAVAQLPHFGGSIALNCATAGAATVFLDKFDAAEVVRVVRERNVTILPLAATMLELLVAELGEGEGLPSVRAVVYGGSAISPVALERAVRVFPNVLIQFYGLAEALAPLTCLTAADHDEPARRASAGRWLPGVDHQFVDGVLEVRGEVVTQRYANRGGEIGSWFRTGDLAHDDDGGYLSVAGRADHVIMSGGYPVQPREVENVIAALDEIAEVAVVGTPHERWGQGVTAVVVTREPVDRGELFATIVDACRASLASYKKPVDLYVVGALPRNPAGKPDRASIIELITTLRAGASGDAHPSTER